MVFNATFNNILVISWWSVLLVEETGVPETLQFQRYEKTKSDLCQILKQFSFKILFYWVKVQHRTLCENEQWIHIVLLKVLSFFFFFFVLFLLSSKLGFLKIQTLLNTSCMNNQVSDTNSGQPLYLFNSGSWSFEYVLLCLFLNLANIYTKIHF